jgi:hypothetical protein
MMYPIRMQKFITKLFIVGYTKIKKLINFIYLKLHIQIYIFSFCVAHNIKYLKMIFFTFVEYIVGYIQIFFLTSYRT